MIGNCIVTWLEKVRESQKVDGHSQKLASFDSLALN